MGRTGTQVDNAGLDADSFAAFVNNEPDAPNPGQDDGTVTTRMGKTYKVLARILADIPTYGTLLRSTWAELAATDAVNEMVAFTPLTDTGTHVDPVSGLVVSNAGFFRRATAGWEWIAS